MSRPPAAARALAAAALAATLASSVTLVGCYAYTPVRGSAPAPATPVRVQLTDSGAVALRGYLGPDVATVSGRVRERTAEGLALAVESTTLRSGAVREWRGEAVTIPAPFIATTEERRVSRARSVGLAGAVVLAAAAFGRALSGATGGSGSGHRPPPGPQ